jgi:hypothetical protein
MGKTGRSQVRVPNTDHRPGRLVDSDGRTELPRNEARLAGLPPADSRCFGISCAHGADVNELKAVTWAVLGPVPAALIVGFGTHLWAVSWGLQLAGSLGYLFGARGRGRAKRRNRAPEFPGPATSPPASAKMSPLRDQQTEQAWHLGDRTDTVRSR